MTASRSHVARPFTCSRLCGLRWCLRHQGRPFGWLLQARYSHYLWMGGTLADPLQHGVRDVTAFSSNDDIMGPSKKKGFKAAAAVVSASPRSTLNYELHFLTKYGVERERLLV
ncbi:hypothetical protein GW17_00058514 [Ensete ventricosum]|nr:hypothetical protein GW17_00058514 [Ensete ventricosum]